MADPLPTHAETPLEECPGVTRKVAEKLGALGITCRDDLLYHLPRRYEDRRHFRALREMSDGDIVTWRGTVQGNKSMRWGGRRVFEATLSEGKLEALGEVVLARWYNMSYLAKALAKDKEIILHGKIVRGKRGWTMTHPDFEVVDDGEEAAIHLGRITPIYPLTEGISQRQMRRIQYLNTRPGAFTIGDDLPAPPDLPPRREAIEAVHFPDTWEARHAGRNRLVYDEFFILQCILAQRRMERESDRIVRGDPKPSLADEFLRRLGFSPTGAQRRVMDEIAANMDRPHPMNRLIQGDVGAGKTVIAVYAMLLAAGQGRDAALMAPTEILAEQHYLNLQRWLEPLGVPMGLYTGSRKEGPASGEGELFQTKPFQEGCGSVSVGTHALLFNSFAAERLGLIVVDEQHKFGVLQRQALAGKGQMPDVLVMTATPIPRTLGMTLYGDLEVSVLDELPPGRQKIVTACRSGKELERVWEFMGKEIAAGRQAYVVYPLVEETEKVDAKAVQAEYKAITARFPQARVELLHGRLKPEEKEAVMADFRAGRVQILVSTSVIEVGVDVPNATLMVIENAERFGLAQLHQLRGRIGRGAAKSYCVLAGDAKSEDSWRRLKIMEETSDGFRIAEEDLKIRGPGNIFGTQQSGLPPLRFGDLIRDAELLQRARDDAAGLVEKDPDLADHPGLARVLREAIPRMGLADVG